MPKKEQQRVRSEIGQLSVAQETMLSEMIGKGMIAATYSLPIIGIFIRRAIHTGMDLEHPRVASTPQAVISLNSSKRGRRRNLAPVVITA